jgi:DtxR family Mn-dependent transcriptional regulator
VSHNRELADQDVEELAEALFSLSEDGTNTIEALAARAGLPAPDQALEELVSRGLAWSHGERVLLTPKGRDLAERQVRRHRLAETLFTTVLEVADERSVDRTACVMEHVIDAALTDSICAFLGHPRRCPHGKPIPAGPCCQQLAQTVEPLVQPLDRLPVGQAARVVYIAPRQPERLTKLLNFGVVPGAIVQLQQTHPAAVLRVGETTLALDPEIAAEIYVKKAR